MNLRERYIQERARFNTGLGELYSFRGVVYTLIGLDVWLKIRFEGGIPLWWMVFIGIGMVLFFWFGGFVWDKLKLFHAQNEFSNKRNPTLLNIWKNTKK